MRSILLVVGIGLILIMLFKGLKWLRQRKRVANDLALSCSPIKKNSLPIMTKPQCVELAVEPALNENNIIAEPLL
jgi:hypothetical protein